MGERNCPILWRRWKASVLGDSNARQCLDVRASSNWQFLWRPPRGQVADKHVNDNGDADVAHDGNKVRSETLCYQVVRTGDDPDITNHPTRKWSSHRKAIRLSKNPSEHIPENRR